MPIIRRRYRTGQTIDLCFFPQPMWPGFGVADHRIAAKADFPRLAAVIGQNYRLPDDTYDTETHFRWPDGTRLRRGGEIITTATVFNEDDAQYAANGVYRADLSVQAVSKAIPVPAASHDRQYYALPAGLLAGTPQALTAFNLAVGQGLKTIELDVGMPDGEDLTGQGINAAAALFQSYFEFSDQSGKAIKFQFTRLGNGKLRFTIYVSGHYGVPGFGILYRNNDDVNASRIAVEFDTNAATFRVFRKVAGIWAELVLDAFVYQSASSYQPAVAIYETNLDGTVHGFAGEAVSLALKNTDAEMEYTGYSVGASSFGLLGTITYSMAVGERRGSTESAGHVLTVDEMPAHGHPIDNVGAGTGAGSKLIIGQNLVAATTTVAGDTGGDEPHLHDIDPEHVVHCVLVKL